MKRKFFLILGPAVITAGYYVLIILISAEGTTVGWWYYPFVWGVFTLAFLIVPKKGG